MLSLPRLAAAGAALHGRLDAGLSPARARHAHAGPVRRVAGQGTLRARRAGGHGRCVLPHRPRQDRRRPGRARRLRAPARAARFPAELVPVPRGGGAAVRLRRGVAPAASSRPAAAVMDILQSLAYGFSVALTPQNLFYCFLGTVLGTAVGVLPGLGTITG